MGGIYPEDLVVGYVKFLKSQRWLSFWVSNKYESYGHSSNWVLDHRPTQLPYPFQHYVLLTPLQYTPFLSWAGSKVFPFRACTHSLTYLQTHNKTVYQSVRSLWLGFFYLKSRRWTRWSFRVFMASGWIIWKRWLVISCLMTNRLSWSTSRCSTRFPQCFKVISSH